ncbi:MAG: hypothetical protein J6R79_03515 [Bacteroidaceae bacterium]|nr:hypothetical protein [Bacteroidaceae bacterium]
MTSTLTFTHIRTYLLAALFVLGNVLLPQLCHLLPLGGLSLQPMFLLIVLATMLMGWQVALITALVSPLVNTMLFDMPTWTMLPLLLIKGVSLVLLLRWALNSSTHKYIRLIAAIVFPQFLGLFLGWTIFASPLFSWQEPYTVLPATLLQIAAIALYKCLK